MWNFFKLYFRIKKVVFFILYLRKIITFFFHTFLFIYALVKCVVVRIVPIIFVGFYVICRFQFNNKRSLRLCSVCLCFCLACQCRFFQQQNFNEVTLLWFQKMWQPICICNFVMHFDLHGWCSFLSFVSNTMPLNFKCTWSMTTTQTVHVLTHPVKDFKI